MIALALGIAPINSFAFGDSFVLIPYLVKQLAQMYQQYAQLLHLVRNGQASLDYLRWINSGLDDISGIVATLPIKDERILEDIRSLQKGIKQIDDLYGRIPKSAAAPMQLLHDQTIAESFKMTNNAKEYAASQEANANQAFDLAEKMSPKGAIRLTAATEAQILHTMTQLLKVNGQLLKLQSEQFAMANMQSKDSVSHFNQVNGDVRKSLSSFSGDMNLPRF